MSLGNFFKNYSKAKGEQLGEGMVNLAASLDASGVSEAAIKQKQDEHNELVKQLVVAQTDFKREKKEFDDIFELYNKKLAAAERAEADLGINPDNKEAATALAELLESVEKIAPKLAKEKAEFESAQRWMTELQQASNDIAKELLGLREQINEVKQQSKEADLEIERTRKAKQQAEKLAGLRNATNKFDVAMTALQKQADAKKQEAEENRIAAEQLRQPVVTESSAATKYMDEVTPAFAAETMQEKLARLKANAK